MQPEMWRMEVMRERKRGKKIEELTGWFSFSYNLQRIIFPRPSLTSSKIKFYLFLPLPPTSRHSLPVYDDSRYIQTPKEFSLWYWDIIQRVITIIKFLSLPSSFPSLIVNTWRIVEKKIADVLSRILKAMRLIISSQWNSFLRLSKRGPNINSTKS